MNDEDAPATNGIVERIVYLPDRYVDFLFVLSLLAFSIGTIYYSIGYDTETGALPLLTAIATSLLIGYLLVKEHSLYLSFLDMVESDPTDEQLETRRKSVVGFLWVIALTALVLIAGMEAGVFAFLLAYYRLQSDLSWKYVVIYSIVIWSVILFLFGFIVQVPLYEGYVLESLQ